MYTIFVHHNKAETNFRIFFSFWDFQEILDLINKDKHNDHEVNEKVSVQ